ncbi:NXPE family member 1-like [Pelobates cultripes]|uniref:NXPE family member 1-like n=1 Tax=Pelobates cultripes TaxID=61616 RepID=A0AAD1QX51_PELCU|nr:NXPE family member 1-like [Pelobates cultripes]
MCLASGGENRGTAPENDNPQTTAHRTSSQEGLPTSTVPLTGPCTAILTRRGLRLVAYLGTDQTDERHKTLEQQLDDLFQRFWHKLKHKADHHKQISVPNHRVLRSNIGVEIPMDTGSIAVVSCQRNIADVKPKCRIGMPMPYPSGYFLNNVWHSNFCNLSSYEPLSQINECLAGKLIYLMGDSTLRQWIEYFQKHMKSLKFFNLPGHGLHKRYLALDIDRNIYIQWKKHGHPFVSSVGYTVKDCAYIAREIDELPGSPNTIVVITLGQHFRGFPVHLFIRRLLNVRRAIERIFLRSPETKVFLKVENSRDMNTDVERISDFHGYIQYLILKDIFKRHNVGVIDAWEMTIAFASYNLHPPETVIRNQINTFLSYLC